MCTTQKWEITKSNDLFEILVQILKFKARFFVTNVTN